MPLPIAVQNRIDTALSSAMVSLANLQTAYRVMHGRFWQGIRNPLVQPMGGIDGTPDRALKPTDQAESWTDFGMILGNLPASIEVDVYDGPQGRGYEIAASLT